MRSTSLSTSTSSRPLRRTPSYDANPPTTNKRKAPTRSSSSNSLLSATSRSTPNVSTTPSSTRSSMVSARLQRPERTVSLPSIRNGAASGATYRLGRPAAGRKIVGADKAARGSVGRNKSERGGENEKRGGVRQEHDGANGHELEGRPTPGTTVRVASFDSEDLRSVGMSGLGLASSSSTSGREIIKDTELVSANDEPKSPLEEDPCPSRPRTSSSLSPTPHTTSRPTSTSLSRLTFPTTSLTTTSSSRSLFDDLPPPPTRLSTTTTPSRPPTNSHPSPPQIPPTIGIPLPTSESPQPRTFTTLDENIHRLRLARDRALQALADVTALNERLRGVNESLSREGERLGVEVVEEVSMGGGGSGGTTSVSSMFSSSFSTTEEEPSVSESENVMSSVGREGMTGLETMFTIPPPSYLGTFRTAQQHTHPHPPRAQPAPSSPRRIGYRLTYSASESILTEDKRTTTTIHHHSLPTFKSTIPIYAAPLEPLYTIPKRSNDGTAKAHQTAPPSTDPTTVSDQSQQEDHTFLPLFQNPRLTFLQTGKHPPSSHHQHHDPLPNLPPHLYAHHARTPSHTTESPSQFTFPLLTPESPNQDQPVTLAGVLRYLGLMRAMLGRAEEGGRPDVRVDGMRPLTGDGEEEVVDLTGGVD